MGKNQLAAQLKMAKENAYSNGVIDGITMGLNICVIALNHDFGFGKERIERLESKVNEIINEIVSTDDPELTKRHIETAIKQIRGNDFEIKRII